MQPVKLEILFDDKTAAGLGSVEGRTDAMKEYVKQIISELQKEMDSLQVKFKQATSQGFTGKEELAQVQALQGEISKLKEQLVSYNDVKKKTVSTPIIDAEKVTKQTNNLSFSIQQVAREMPTLAMGPQMFFLAISNNLPILSDEIKRTAAANKLLKESGQTCIPVWRQMLSSILSWQTAMIVAITLSVAYGKEIGNWISSLFKAKEGVDSLKKAQDDLNTAERKAGESSASQVAKLRILYSASQDTARSLKERNDAIDNLQKQYPSYFGNLSNEAILAGKAAGQYEKLTQALINAGKAKALQDIVSDYTKQNYQTQRGLNADINYTNKHKEEYEKAKRIVEDNKKLQEDSKIGSNAGFEVMGGNTFEEKLVKEYEKRLQNIEEYKKSIKNNNDNIEQLSKNINIDDLLFNETNTSSDSQLGKDKQNYQELLNKAHIDAYNKVEQVKISIMEDGLAKRKAMLKQQYDEEISSINDNEAKLLDKLQKGVKNGTVKDPKTQEAKIKNDASLERGIVTDKYDKDRISAENEVKEKLLLSYQDYFAKRKSIKNKYEKDYTSLKSVGADQSTLDENKYQENKALEDIDSEFATRSETFNNWASQVVNLSLDQLRTLLTAAKQELEKMEKSDPNNAAIAQSRAKVNILESSINKQQNKINTNPDKSTIKNWQDLQRTLQDTSREFKQIGDEIGGTAGKFLAASGEVASSTISMISGIMTLADGTGAAIGKTGEAATAALSTMEKASVILAVISAAMQIATKIASLFTGKSKAEKDSDRLNSVTDKLKSTNEAINNLIEKRIELIKEAALAEKSSLSASTQKAIDAQKLYYEQQFNSLKGNWILAKKGKNNNLTLNDLGISSIKELEEFLNDPERIKSFQNNGYGFRDYDSFKSLVDGYNDLIEKSNELKEATNEALSGLTLDDAKSSFDDLLLSADTTFDDVQNSLEDHFKNAFLNIEKSKYLNNAMKNWYDNFVNANSTDGLDKDEIEALRKEYNEIFKQAQQDIKDMSSITGISLSSSSQSGHEGALSSMTQEQGTKLEGMFTSVQDHCSGMHSLLKDIKKNNEEDNKILAQIAENTSHIKPIYDTLSRLENNGIKIKK